MTVHKPPTESEVTAYQSLIEVSSLLEHGVEQQLRADGDLSFVQFQVLARLVEAPGGSARMTDLADGIVYSRSALTYQAGLLDKAGLVSREQSVQDERSVTVTVTQAGRARVDQVMPGHVDVIRALMFEPLRARDVAELIRILGLARDRMRAAPPRSATRSRRIASVPSGGPAPASGPAGGTRVRRTPSGPGAPTARSPRPSTDSPDGGAGLWDGTHLRGP